MDPARERLNAAMNESRLDLRLRWTQLAERAGIDSSTLRRIRYGEGAVSDLAARGIEDALEWPHGFIATLLSDEPVDDPGDEEDRLLSDARTATIREAYQALSKEYGRERARKMINEILSDVRDSILDHEWTDERGAG